MDKQDAGAASGVVSTAGQLGWALGVAVLGTVFFGLLPRRATVAGFSAGLHGALYVEIGVFLLAAVLTCVLPKVRVE